MPLFEFECQRCGEVFEIRTPSLAKAVEPACPACGATTVERLWSPFSRPTTSGGGCGGGVPGFS